MTIEKLELIKNRDFIKKYENRYKNYKEFKFLCFIIYY